MVSRVVENLNRGCNDKFGLLSLRPCKGNVKTSKPARSRKIRSTFDYKLSAPVHSGATQKCPEGLLSRAFLEYGLYGFVEFFAVLTGLHTVRCSRHLNAQDTKRLKQYRRQVVVRGGNTSLFGLGLGNAQAKNTAAIGTLSTRRLSSKQNQQNHSSSIQHVHDEFTNHYA